MSNLAALLAAQARARKVLLDPAAIAERQADGARAAAGNEFGNRRFGRAFDGTPYPRWTPAEDHRKDRGSA